MRKNMLIACSSVGQAMRLECVFSDLEEIRLLPTARNGFDCLRVMNEQRVDILLLDLFLAGMDGYSIIRATDAFSDDRRPLVFILTALADDRLLMPIKDRALYCFATPMDESIIQLRVLALMHMAESEATAEAPCMDRLEARIADDVRQLGIPAHLKGCYYLRDAIRIYALSDAPTKLSVTNDIYPTIAKLYNTRPPLVEHAIRNAIEIASTRGNLTAIHMFFGYTVNDKKGKPSNLEFIALMAHHALGQAD